MKKANTAKIKALTLEALSVMNELEKMKPLYNRIDEITLELSATGSSLFEAGGEQIKIIDNFDTKNTMFKTTSVKRFELKKVFGGKK